MGYRIVSRTFGIRRLIAGLIPAAMCAITLSSDGQDKREKPLTSGIPAGKYISAFLCYKCSGAEGDGVKQGEELCYVCRYEERPVVLIFVSKRDDRLGRLVKELDKLVAAHKKEKLAGIVAFIGADEKTLRRRAQKLAAEHRIRHIPVVVPSEKTVTGPLLFKLNPRAEITIILYADSIVRSNHALITSELTLQRIERIIQDTRNLLER